MVYDTLANASIYRSLSPAVALGLDWLAKFQLETPVGRYDIDGDKVFALVQTYGTLAASAKKYETHRLYLDIQYVAEGRESILYLPRAELTPTTTYDAAKDFVLYSEPTSAVPVSLPFGPGTFAIFYPADGHKPGCLDGAPQTIKKVVIKARV